MAPKGLGLRWTLIGQFNTGNGPRVLSNATATPIFNIVWNNNRKALSALGFGIDGRRGGIAFWGKIDDVQADLDAKIAAVVIDTRRLRNEYRRQYGAQIAESRRAEKLRKEEMEARRKAARENLARIMAEQFWAIHHRYLDEVKVLAEKRYLDDADVARIESIVTSTDKTIAKARASLDQEAKTAADDLRFCEDAGVRGTILTVVRHITGNDEDWAAERNDIGWSKATTVVGHVLAMAEDLSALHAAHALRLLRVHRKQVPAEHREVLRLAA